MSGTKGTEMRLALLIFALMTGPAFANTAPPDAPTYEKPTFEKPEKPTEPEKPQKPEEPDEPDNPDPVVRSTPPATNLASCPKVTCVTGADGKRHATFTADVQPDMYYLGRNFCASAPQDMEVSACCLEDNGTYKILYNTAVSKKAHWKAQQFCTCVLELD